MLSLKRNLQFYTGGSGLFGNNIAFQTIFLHETGNDLEWPRESHGHLSSYFPSGESHCARARGGRKGSQPG